MSDTQEVVDELAAEPSDDALDAAVAEGLGVGGGSAPAAAEPPAPEFAPEEFTASAPGGAVGDVNLESILEIPVTLAIEIGRTRMSIRDLLQLNQGSVVELDRFAGEPLDVLVNGTLVAHGEVVVVNEKFGVRLSDVISASERVRKLG